jgi:LPXTG-motif cell wall-anchored protein
VALSLVLMLASPLLAQAQPSTPTVKVTADPKLGNMLTDGQGKSLYMYGRDDNNVSNCYDACAQRWPVLTVPAGSQPTAGSDLNGTLGVTTRRDGAQQVTYNGMPLYYFAGDNAPGDTAGQNVGNVWFVIAPGAVRASFPPAPPAAPAAAPAAAQPSAPAAQPAQLPRTGEADFPLYGLGALGALLVLVGSGLALRRQS